MPRATAFSSSKGIREMVLFAQHDVILDPPFTRLDILCCRNLLIYFNAALQRRLVPLFHYSLRPGGVLVLGGSETVGRAKSLFAPLSPKSRLYRRSDVATDAGWVDFPVNRYRSSRQPRRSRLVPQPINPPPNLQSLADHVLLQEFSPPAVLVNDAGRHRLHQRPHGQVPRARGGQGQLEHPRDGAAGHSLAAGGGPATGPGDPEARRTARPAAGGRRAAHARRDGAGPPGAAPRCRAW